MNKEILNTNNQLVIRGIDESTISKMEETLKEEKRLFIIYATAREFLDYGLEKFPPSPYLALFECLDNTDDSFIVEKHQKLEEPIEWGPIAGSKRGFLKLNQNKDG
jgi:hypothetical protein